MIGPTRENISSILERDRSFYESWFLVGIRNLIESGGDRTSFGADISTYIGIHGTIDEDLEALFACMAPHEQEEFSQGLALAVSRSTLCSPAFAADIARPLVALAARVRAYCVLPILNGVVSRIALQAESDCELDGLFSVAIDAALAIATPTANSAAVIRQLVSHKRMPSRLAGAALIRLCEAEPERLIDHLHLLWRNLTIEYGWVGLTRTQNVDHEQAEFWRTVARERLISDVFERAHPDAFINSLAKTSEWTMQSFMMPAAWAEISDWWSETLCSGSQEMTRILSDLTLQGDGILTETGSESASIGSLATLRSGDDDLHTGLDQASISNEEAVFQYVQEANPDMITILAGG